MSKYFYLNFVGISLAFFLSINNATAADQELSDSVRCPFHSWVDFSKEFRFELCPRHADPITHTFNALQGKTNKTPIEQYKEMGRALDDVFEIYWEDKHWQEYGKRGLELFHNTIVRRRLVKDGMEFGGIFTVATFKFFDEHNKNPPLEQNLEFLLGAAKGLEARLKAGDFDSKPEAQAPAKVQEIQEVAAS
jgi:hypothetical protein